MNALAKAVAQAGQFDLANPQHLAMRKILAHVYVNHVINLDLGVLPNVESAFNQAVGINSAALWCLEDDINLWKLSGAVVDHMRALQEAYEARRWHESSNRSG